MVGGFAKRSVVSINTSIRYWSSLIRPHALHICRVCCRSTRRLQSDAALRFWPRLRVQWTKYTFTFSMLRYENSQIYAHQTSFTLWNFRVGPISSLVQKLKKKTLIKHAVLTISLNNAPAYSKVSAPTDEQIYFGSISVVEIPLLHYTTNGQHKVLLVSSATSPQHWGQCVKLNTLIFQRATLPNSSVPAGRKMSIFWRTTLYICYC